MQTRAPAKINLSLHVVGRRDDGYHDLESLVAFAGVSDLLTFSPERERDLVVEGPTAGAAGAGANNLVTRATAALAGAVPGLRTGAFHLVKRLPVAAGIGGGSSDAAAALRLLADHNHLALDDARVLRAARETGADIPVCLDPRARMMAGFGERLGAPLHLPPLYAVLVNPGVAVETRRVFAAMGLNVGEVRPAAAHPACAERPSIETLLALLHRCRNDMQAAAEGVAPVIGDVLDTLGATPGCRLARMSGSGATCFALFDTCHAAARAARLVRASRPDWWVKPTLLR